MLEENLVRQPESCQVITRTSLERLTTKDLVKMADNFGVDIPPDLDRIFIIEELLEVASPEVTPDDVSADISAMPDVSVERSSELEQEASRDSAAEADMADSDLVEPVPLPRQYNITFIEVMIRDPLWAFVFWEIKAQDKEQFEKARDFEGYYLKVSPLPATFPPVLPVAFPPLPSAAGAAQTGAEGVFTVAVNPDDTAWYLGLSPAVQRGKTPLAKLQHEQKQYRVELCAAAKNEETVLAISSPFRLPLLHGSAAEEARLFAAENPAIILSGYEDFSVVRSSERLPRTRRSVLPGLL